MGAWIETRDAVGLNELVKSRSTWARGLKPRCLVAWVAGGLVALHVGAWIETTLLYRYLLILLSGKTPKSIKILPEAP